MKLIIDNNQLMKLLNKQKIKLYEDAENIGLDKTLFLFENGSINYGDEYFIKYGQNPDPTADIYDKDYYFVCTPGTKLYTQEYYSGDFESIYKFCYIWMLNIKEEIELGDPWVDFIQEQGKINFIFKNDTTSFSPSDKEVVSSKILNTKKILETSQKYNSEEITVINEKLDYLITKMDDLNKFDWNTYFLGTITSIILQCTFGPEGAILLWNTLQQQFNNNIIG